MKKDTFIIRTEWMGSILELPELDRATIFINLFYFHSGQENLINLNNLQVKLVWKLIEPNLHSNIKAYSASVENGKLGGRPPKNNKPNKPKKRVANLIVPVTVTDTVTEPDFTLENILKDFPEYNPEMITDFFMYWSEKNKNGVMKWEMEKTWETNLRLAKWKRNNDKYKNDAPFAKKEGKPLFTEAEIKASRDAALKAWGHNG